MPTVKGSAKVRGFLQGLPAEIEKKLLRGAARAAANVIADEARDRTQSHEVRDAIKVATKSEPGRIIGKVQVKGPGSYLAPWEEYGTAPHFISVDESQRQGMSIARINTLNKAGSLVIGGRFVGDTVYHPGARPHPFLRPSLDLKAKEAVDAAQGYINKRISKSGIAGPDESDGDDA